MIKMEIEFKHDKETGEIHGSCKTIGPDACQHEMYIANSIAETVKQQCIVLSSYCKFEIAAKKKAEEMCLRMHTIGNTGGKNDTAG